MIQADIVKKLAETQGNFTGHSSKSLQAERGKLWLKRKFAKILSYISLRMNKKKMTVSPLKLGH